MNCIDMVLNYIKSQTECLDQFPLILNEDTLTKVYSDFYGDTISQIIKDRENSKLDIASDMRLNPRVWGYIISRMDSKFRPIRFYEALRFCVVTNLPIEESICFINICNYSLCFKRLRDRLIYLILCANHHTNLELDTRLDCLSALQDNEPYNDNNYDYLTLFAYVRRKRESVL